MGLTRPRAEQIFDIDYKQAVRVITLTNISLTGGAPNQVDSVNLVADDRILVAGQTTGSQNGLYKVDTVGSGSDGTWIRTSDGNQTGEIDAGMIVMVTEGTIYHDSQWKLITDDPIIIGTTSLSFEQNFQGPTLVNGTSNVRIPSANANILVSANGTSNVAMFSADGLSSVGNITAQGYLIGNGAFLTGIVAAAGAFIESGTSNVLVQANANVLVKVSNTPNVVVFASTGQYTTGVISATGNITGNYILGNGSQLTGIDATSIQSGTSNVKVVSSGGNVSVGVGGTPNITVFSTTGSFVTGVVSASGNITGANLNTAGVVSAVGNITGNFFLGNGSQLSGIITSVANINNGTSIMEVVSSGGNIRANIGGTPNVQVIASTGVFVTGVQSASGNVTGANINTGGVISATGNVTGGNLTTSGVISATGNVSGGNLNVTGNIVDTGALSIITGSNGNIALAPNGTGIVTASGAFSASGNITGGNIIATANLYYNGNTLVTRVLTVGTRDLPVIISLTASGSFNVLTRSGNVTVTTTT
jgi:hypothetical protein